jgi:putative oxidoreductase
MAVLSTLARPLLASIFVMQGLDNLRRPERVAPVVEPVVRSLADWIPGLPVPEPEQAVRAKGAVHVAVGCLLALGVRPRLTSLALAATLVPTTLAAHRFWAAADAEERMQKRIHFAKNLSILGGLLLSAGDGSPAARR